MVLFQAIHTLSHLFKYTFYLMNLLCVQGTGLHVQICVIYNLSPAFIAVTRSGSPEIVIWFGVSMVMLCHLYALIEWLEF